MSDRAPGLRAAFLAMHVPGDPLVVPNPWDVGSAQMLRAQGFRALATTSSGFAAAAGRGDGEAGRDASLAYAAAVVGCVDIPVTADLENGFGDSPAEVAGTVAAAVESGLAGCSIEDFTGRPDDPIHRLEAAVDRITAAAEAARRGPGLVLTARAENFLHGNPDLAGTIARLQAFQEAGADVLYAPGITDLRDVRTVVSSVDRPVNVLARPGLHSLPALAEAGAARVSVGGALMFAAYEAAAGIARRLLDGTALDYFDQAAAGARRLAEARSAG
ncbi:isocitrate lyase/PEP mutase family protein [Tomitella gaofuii]|uniref:isocitrate lyase/PEP mutase family protein n=1 Tax=Tomitella gaofuii TaxID=2760083 RepID=UPI001C713742|nr:isocitrate lyase/phosphoenolpyruvate mutase family protein [Tomitella gaofuii]